MHLDAKVFASRGVGVTEVPDSVAALKLVKSLIVPGSSVMTGGSKTLEAIGLPEYLASDEHSWTYLKPQVMGVSDKTERFAARQHAALADCWVGGVNAVSETGQLVWASGSGSQLPAYAYTAKQCIWVAGRNKVVPTLSAAVARVRDYVIPLYVEKATWETSVETALGKLMIFEREEEASPRRLDLMIVDEDLGY